LSQARGELLLRSRLVSIIEIVAIGHHERRGRVYESVSVEPEIDLANPPEAANEKARALEQNDTEGDLCRN
jgi:hypothetical protein